MMLHPGDFRMYMRQLAGWVWQAQAEAHSFGLSLQEETITEMLLLETAKRLTPLGLNVKMFSKQREGGLTRNGRVLIEAEGADWEWFVSGRRFVRHGQRCDVSFRVQAKRLYHDEPSQDGHYGGFKPGSKQIDDLINRANAIDSNPIYVFYNHPDVKDVKFFNRWVRGRGYPFGPSQWGCAVTTAQAMKIAGDNRLSTIFPMCVPWHDYFGVGRDCDPSAETARIGRLLGLEGEEAQPFVVSREPPSWVRMLRRSDANLTDYLFENGLQGVVHFDYSDLEQR